MSKICLGNKRYARWVIADRSADSRTSTVHQAVARYLISPQINQLRLNRVNNALASRCIKVDRAAYIASVSRIVFRSDEDVKKSRVSAYEYLVP